MLEEKQLQVFLAYTSRFDQIMQSLPIEVRDPEDRSEADRRLDVSKAIGTPDIRHAVLRYINLCSEEFYLRQNKLIQDEIWDLWARHMKTLLKTPVMNTIWSQVSSYYDESFVNFVDE